MSGRRDIFDRSMSAGHSAAWDQNWDRAIAAYRAALQEFPDDPTALTSFGLALLQADRLEDALRAYQRAAALTPGDPVAPEKCGEIFEQLGRLNEATQTYLAVAEIHLTKRDVSKAIENWNRAVRLTPDNLGAHSRLARALENTGKPREAAIEYLEVARLFQRANDNEKALQAAGYALKLDPQLPVAREAVDKIRRGQPLPVPERPKTPSLSSLLRHEPSKPAPAEESTVIKGATPLDAAREVALARLAEMLFEEDTDTSKTASSMDTFTKGTGPLPGSPAKRAQAIMFLGQAISHQTNGEVDAAINNYESALDAGLKHPAVHFALGALFLDRRSPKAIEQLQAATDYDSLRLGAHYGLGQMYLHQGKAPQALKHLLSAMKALDVQLTAPERREALTDAYENIADAMLRSAAADASATAQSILKFLTGDDWELRAQRSRQQLDKNAEGGRVTTLADLLATPGADRVLEAMRRIEEHMAKKFWATAMEEAYHTLEFAPNHLPVHLRMAEILMAENRANAATAKYTAIANAYHIRGDLARAGKVMQEVLRLNPLDVKVRGELIELLTTQGKMDEAMAQYLDLADTYYQLTDLPAARSTYETALRLAQKSNVDTQWSVRFLLQLIDIEMQRLNWREALRLCEQIKAFDPDNAKGRATLIDLHFRVGNTTQALSELDGYLRQMQSTGQGATAVPVLEELLLDHPGNPALLLRLAGLYQHLGRKQDAIVQYEAAADAQLNAGENTQAIATIRAILALGPDNAADYHQLLSQLQGQS